MQASNTTHAIKPQCGCRMGVAVCKTDAQQPADCGRAASWGVIQCYEGAVGDMQGVATDARVCWR